MEKDFVFRSSVFGGFNKQDVMAYLAAINAETADLKQRYDAAARDAEIFLKRITELEAEVSENASLAAQIDTEKAKSIELENELVRLTKENEMNRASMAVLESEKEKLTQDCEKLKAVESQLGAAMLDARLYSEKLVSQATAKVSEINKETGQAITKTAGKIGALSGNIRELACVFNKALAEVEARIRTLVADMDKSADELNKNNLDFVQNSVTKDFEEAASKSDDDSSGSVYYLGSI
ncbi:MAG: hypothetical protein BWY46_00538 [Firmicutes bacterium ADurb.Bin300]|nr:MAG: hypothetical protein BWY46_00538 [Firmicutes bacterium ADurb.Bin300]